MIVACWAPACELAQRNSERLHLCSFPQDPLWEGVLRLRLLWLLRLPRLNNVHAAAAITTTANPRQITAITAHITAAPQITTIIAITVLITAITANPVPVFS